MNEMVPPRRAEEDASPQGEPSDDRDFLLPPKEGSTEGEAPSRMPSRWLFAGVGVVLLALLAWGIYGHWRKGEQAAGTAGDATRPVSVRVVVAKAEDGPVDITLPGETQAFDVANIYARATGYVAERRVDIGARVRRGDVMLHIASPDLDQQLAQAKAQLGQVQAALVQAEAQVTQADANINLAKVTLGRTASLVGQGYETLQNRDTQQANLLSQQATGEAARAGVKVAEANVKAQQATIDRLQALTAFEDVTAPFDGVVTSRNVDIGALINADSATGTPLLTVARDDVLRVMVQVPQEQAVGVHDGLETKVTVPQFPGRVFEGKVSRSSVALVSSARTLTTEVDIPNMGGLLRSGLYAYVSIAVPRTHPDVVVPAEATMFNQNGLQVALAGEDNKARLQPVTVYRDHGTWLELGDGLKGGERVILSPPATLETGSAIRIEEEGAGGKGKAAGKS